MSGLWILTLAVLVNSALFYALPILSRPGVFFSVTVPAAFRRDVVAHRALYAYRTAVVVGAALAIGLMMAAPSPRWRMAGLLVPNATAVAAWIWARSRVRPYAVAEQTTRVASLSTRPASFPGGWPAVAGPFVIMGAAAGLLIVNWDLIPDRFAHHWDAAGAPDRWSRKSIATVFRPFLMGFVILGLTCLQTWWLLTRTKQVAATGASADAERRFKRTQAQLGLAAMYTMAVLFSYIGTRSLFAIDATLGVGAWIILGFTVVMSIAATMWMARVGQGGQRTVPEDERATVGDATPDSAWKAGLFYFNRSDPAVFVERRMGLGWTLNFGNKWAWAFTAALTIPLVVVLLMR